MAAEVPASLTDVDWSTLPPPVDDGSADHLRGALVPDIDLASTGGGQVSLARLQGLSVVYVYPLTGRPGVALPDGWDEIPGGTWLYAAILLVQGSLRELLAGGADQVFGLSTQDAEYQREAVERLHLPFPLLSDAALRLTTALRLPVMVVDGATLLKRMALIIEDGAIVHVFYPVFPPDRNAGDVLNWLRAPRG